MKTRLTRWLNVVVVLALFSSLSVLGTGAAAADGAFARKLQHLVDENVMAGAVMLVGDKDKVFAVEAVGYSDLAAKTPMKTDDLFWIASMSKSITAAALLILVDDGNVKLNDPVEKFIPEFKTLKVAKPDKTLVPPSHPITVREILCHTSGMRFLNAKDKSIIDSVPLAESIKNDLLEPLLFDPGTGYKYSNEGIDTAGRIIEIVSGMPFEKFLEGRLFRPLGMKDTTFFPSTAQLKRLAKSYRMKKDKSGLEDLQIAYLKYPLDGPGRYPAPGGGLFSTAHDIACFCQMLANGGTFRGRVYLSKESVHEMTIKQTGPLVKDNYGLGVSAQDGTVFGHGGAYKTNMTVDHGQVRVFLVQQSGAWAKGNPHGEFTAEAKRIYPPAGAVSGSAK